MGKAQITGDLDEIVAADPIGKGPNCTVAVLLATLPPGLLEKFKRHLAGDTKGATLARSMTTLGYRIRQDSIQRHRRGACACDRH